MLQIAKKNDDHAKNINSQLNEHLIDNDTSNIKQDDYGSNLGESSLQIINETHISPTELDNLHQCHSM